MMLYEPVTDTPYWHDPLLEATGEAGAQLRITPFSAHTTPKNYYEEQENI